jgi:hypothetical protein
MLVKDASRLQPNQRDPDLLVASRAGRMFALQFYRDRLSQYSYTIPGGKAGYPRELEVQTRNLCKWRPENASR